MDGTLWIVGTPIGNLGDISDRAGRTLAKADVIACEDTRRTRALLAHLAIPAPRLISFFEGNEERQVPRILDEVRSGRHVALVTDAGMPSLSDPGYLLIRAAVEAGLTVDVVPGPSAALAALVISGLPTDRFSFEGFLPRRAAARRARLAELAGDPRTLVLYESPRRLGLLLADAADLFGDRAAAVVRELTKVHQEVARAPLGDLAARFREETPRGEVVVVIGGAPPAAPPDLDELGRRAQALTAAGLSRREAAARVAAEAGASRREVYEASLHHRSPG